VRYISTRHGSQGSPAPLGFEEIMLAGLARDGGLYLPAEWPHFSPAEIARLKGLSYAELAFRIMQAFVGVRVRPFRRAQKGKSEHVKQTLPDRQRATRVPATRFFMISLSILGNGRLQKRWQ